MQPHDTTNEPSVKLCECGCGQPAPIAKATNRTFGHIKGQPTRFIKGHNAIRRDVHPPNPSGLCMCGCGQPTHIAKQTHRPTGALKGHATRYISGHHRRQQAEQRFWEYVDKRGPDDCWMWQGPRETKGYGALNAEGQKTKAHRFSYELHYGPIPEGLGVLHRCDNPPCCNPAHLFLGDNAANTADMMAKGRDRHAPQDGEANPNARFSNAEVAELRAQFAQLNMSMTKFACLHGVAHTTMIKILKGISYQDG